MPSALSKSIPVFKSGKAVIAQAQLKMESGAFVIGSLERIDVETKATQVIIISLLGNYQSKQRIVSELVNTWVRPLRSGC